MYMCGGRVWLRLAIDTLTRGQFADRDLFMWWCTRISALCGIWVALFSVCLFVCACVGAMTIAVVRECAILSTFMWKIQSEKPPHYDHNNGSLRRYILTIDLFWLVWFS